VCKIKLAAYVALQEHNCVRELRAVVQQQQSRVNDLQMDVNEIRIQYTELRRELRTVRVRAILPLSLLNLNPCIKPKCW